MSIWGKRVIELAAIEKLLTAFFEGLTGKRIDFDQSVQDQLHLDNRAWVELTDKINAVPQFKEQLLFVTLEDMRRSRTVADIAIAMFASKMNVVKDRSRTTKTRKLTFDSVVLDSAGGKSEPSTDSESGEEITVWY